MKKEFFGISVKKYCPFILIIIFILVAAVLYMKPGWTFFKSTSFLPDQLSEDKLLDLDKFPQDSSIPKSNFEWFQRSIGKVKKGIMKKSILTTTVTGRITSIEYTPKKIPIDSKYYYVGAKGYYYSEGSIVLAANNNITNSFAFSKKRMDLMTVYRFTNQGVIKEKFSDLKVGDMVEIEESVDLSLPNIDDQNVIYVNIRIFN